MLSQMFSSKLKSALVFALYIFTPNGAGWSLYNIGQSTRQYEAVCISLCPPKENIKITKFEQKRFHSHQNSSDVQNFYEGAQTSVTHLFGFYLIAKILETLTKISNRDKISRLVLAGGQRLYSHSFEKSPLHKSSVPNFPR